MLGKAIGNYKLMAELGRGAHGVVYRALDQARARPVAVKALYPQLTEQAAVSERLRTLAPSIAQLRHPQLAEFYTTLQQGTELYLVTELIEGRTLAAVLQQAGVLSGEDAARLIAQICEPLTWLGHAGWAHGGLKPSNLLMTSDGQVKITDLGLAYALGDQAVHTVASGLAYRAPEQLRAAGFDARSDVYALGALLYELVTGLQPFRRLNDEALRQAHLHEDAPSPRNYFPLIPAALEQILLRALAKRPEDRFAAPAALQAALNELLPAPSATTARVPFQLESATPAVFAVPTQAPVPDTFEGPALPTPDAPDTFEGPSLDDAPPAAATVRELPLEPPLLPLPESGARATKPIAAAAVTEAASLNESGRLPKVTAITRAPPPEPDTPSLPTASLPTASLYDEMVIELDDASQRRRSRWTPWLAIAGLAALVGVPYALMRNGNSSAPALPSGSTLSLPSPTPTATPEPSPLPIVVASTPLPPVKRAPTPRVVIAPKATPKVTPTAAPVRRVTPTPVPAPTRKPAKPTPEPEPTPKSKQDKKGKKNGGLGGFFKDILTGKDKGKKAEPSATPKKKY